MRRFLLALPLLLAACAEPVWAPDDAVQRALYVHDGPPSLTLFTVVSNHNGSGGHTALMVNGAHRAIFDPAGTFQHPALPERNDVIYGMTDKAVAFYKDYHGRETYHVVIHEIPVTREVADLAMRKIQAYGAVPKASCANATSSVLRQLPGFETMPNTFFPKVVMNYFEGRPGVTRSEFHDDSSRLNRTIEAPAIL